MKPGFENLAWEYWDALNNTMTKINADLSQHCSTINGKETTNAKFLNPIKKGFKTLESNLNDVSCLLFSLTKELDTLSNKVNNVESIVNKNRATGDLVSKIQDSAAYKNICSDLQNSDLQTKIYNFDLGKQVEGHREVSQAVRTSLSNSTLSDSTKKASVTILSKSTKFVNGKHAVPILLKCNSKIDQISLEKNVRDKGYNTAFHWPKELIEPVKKIREQLVSYKSEVDNIDMTKCHILIRPNFETGKSLQILYRLSDQTTDRRWKTWFSCPTPAPISLAKKFGNEQPANKSKFFSI